MGTITHTSPLNETTIRAGLILGAEIATPSSAFTGTDPSNAIVTEDRPGTGRGETLKMRFSRVPLDDDPKMEGEQVIGAEWQPDEYENSLTMYEEKFDAAIEGVEVEQNRVSFSLKQERLTALAMKWGYAFERGRINHLVGNTVDNTAVTKYRRSFGDPVVAQDANHIYRCRTSAGAQPATDALVAADATCVLDSDAIEELVEHATSNDRMWPLLPCRTPFGEKFVLYVHGQGYRQLKANVSGNSIFTLHQAAVQGGVDLADTPFLTGEGFIYDKVLVVRNPWMPQGLATSSTYQANTRVACLFGRRAMHQFWGTGYTDGDHIGYSEHTEHRRLSMLTDSIFGSNRNIVNGESWASFRVVHYSPV